ncbi:MAG: adenosine kinase [Hyphomicrobiaceae bacterium]
MGEKLYDVAGIGNAIVDVIGRCSDDFLAEHGATKGAMRLIDTDTVLTLYRAMGPAVEISGGSAANTMVGISSFGGKAAFIGKVADDELGRIFGHDIRSAGVTFETKPAAPGSEPTARSLILVTPDGERTMNTFLGVSPELDNSEVDEAVIGKAKVVYLEGYLFDRPAAKVAFRQAAKIAKDAGAKVALTLSDAFCVERHRAEFLDLIKADIDILLANESEIKSLYKTQNFEDAVRNVKGHCDTVALTRSAKGSLILAGDRAATIAPEPVNRVMDSTGAGDLYAAGFLYGLTHGRSLEDSGRLASIAAAEIISHVGARPETSLTGLAKLKGL